MLSPLLVRRPAYVAVDASRRASTVQRACWRAPVTLWFRTVCGRINAFVRAEPSDGTIAGFDGRSQVNRVFFVTVS